MEDTKNVDYLSLGWFKDTVVKAIEKAAETAVTNTINNTAINNIEVVTTPIKLYSQARLVGDVLTVVFLDGSLLSKPDANVTHWESVRAATSEAEIINIMASPEARSTRIEEKKTESRNKVINDGLKVLLRTGDFKLKDKHVYLRGTSRTIPTLLVEHFAAVVGKYADLDKHDFKNFVQADYEYQGLKRFFMWCCLNPRAEVANDLYDFLATNSFRITKQGFFVALRNVVTVESGDKALVEFVSNAYNKVKAVWKKNPSAFNVFKNNTDNTYFLSAFTTITDQPNVTNVGNLTKLYLELPNMLENRYTDAHTKTFDIRVGQVVNMPMSECNWSTADCAHAGLHFTSDQINYVGCGDTSVLILINPMKVVGIGEYKGRCYEYLPIMTVPRNEATAILHDGAFDTLELDEAYANDELDQLALRAQGGFIVEATKHEFNLPSISTKEINMLVSSLSEMSTVIKSRVNNIK
jgi:hypothetical protein